MGPSPTAALLVRVGVAVYVVEVYDEPRSSWPLPRIRCQLSTYRFRRPLSSSGGGLGDKDERQGRTLYSRLLPIFLSRSEAVLLILHLCSRTLQRPNCWAPLHAVAREAARKPRAHCTRICQDFTPCLTRRAWEVSSDVIGGANTATPTSRSVGKEGRLSHIGQASVGLLRVL